ncbi:serine/threonine kinase family protein [Plesiocystis pacifica SIR-1]|uniref:Serine/threonine kinase family protein n=2 Tax=Plesiocystis pacifica TaxID=191768 RepID=A6GJ92_9BACT|nr:serine/threonine kinase family protein [Plesiocystis pacifica SIR-1]
MAGVIPLRPETRRLGERADDNACTEPGGAMAMAEVTDERGPIEPTLDDPLVDSAPGEGCFEHERVLNEVRRRLFGRGPTTRIGRYRVLRSLGAGGMGEVYLGRDEELGREVAIKRVRTGELRGAEQERLRREARALARLSHPNVVQVYEVGTEGGRTFVAMEFVDGATLGQWLSAEPRSWREILEVFLAAGRGLAAAHGAGLIHRDFKPDNVLLSDAGEVRVADFGLVLEGDEVAARRSERSEGASLGLGLAAAPSRGSDLGLRVSAHGAILGTIRYMALEQLCGLEVDARSDQFSFCVALYEALYDAPPFVCSSALARLEALRDDDPRVPQSGRGRAPRGLWRVLCRGLAREPEARWSSMEELLGQLERAAGRRRRAWLGAAGVATGFAAALALVLLPGADETDETEDRCALVERELHGVWDADARTGLEARYAGLEAEHAADSVARVSQGLERWSGAWVEARGELCVAQRDHAVAPELARAQGLCLERQRRAVGELVELLLEPASVDPARRGDELARAVEFIAAQPSPEACQTQLALLGLEPPPAEAVEAVEGVRLDIERAHQLRVLGRLERGAELAEASDLAAVELGYGPLMAEARAERGKAELATGSLTRGRELVQEAIDLAERHGHDALAAELWLAQALRTVSDFRELERGRWELRRATVADSRLEPSTRRQARLADARAQLAHVSGDRLDAERAYVEALELSAEDPLAALDRPTYLGNLADLIASEDAERALEYRREAVFEAEELFGPGHPEVGMPLYKLGNALLDVAGEDEQAKLALQRAVAIWSSSHSRPHEELVLAKLVLGTLALRAGRSKLAESYADAAEREQRETLPDAHPSRVVTEHLRVAIHAARGEHHKALVHTRRALSMLEQRFSLEHPHAQQMQLDAVASLLALGHLDEAMRLLETVQTPSPRSPLAAPHHLNWCEVHLRRGELDAALEDLQALDGAYLGSYAFSHAFLSALVEVRRGGASRASLDRLSELRRESALSQAQVLGWWADLGVTKLELAELGIDAPDLWPPPK